MAPPEPADQISFLKCRITELSDELASTKGRLAAVEMQKRGEEVLVQRAVVAEANASQKVTMMRAGPHFPH